MAAGHRPDRQGTGRPGRGPVIFARPRSRLDPAALRLPLIALIDVVLFLLMYFLLHTG